MPTTIEILEKSVTDFADASNLQLKEVVDRLTSVEQKMAHKPFTGSGDLGSPNGSVLADMISGDENFKALIAGKSKHCRILVPTMQAKSALVNATGASQPLVSADRLQTIVPLSRRALRIRDLLGAQSTTSNQVEYARESVVSGSAGPQYTASPEAFEGVPKQELGLTFTLASERIVTLAATLPVSTQVLSDAPGLTAFLQDTMGYHLALEVEDEILNGDGSAGQLNGLRKTGNYQVFNRGSTGDTRLDTLRKVLTQLQINEYEPTGIVLAPGDWEAIELIKDDAGNYVCGGPRMGTLPSVWNIPLVVSNAISEGNFLAGDFAQAATVFERESVAFEFGFVDKQFASNMITARVETRLALCVFQPKALVGGTF